MRFHVYKMDPVGAVAVCNLGAFASAIGLAKLWHESIGLVALVLASPLGLPFMAHPGPNADPTTEIMKTSAAVVLNAYLWGLVFTLVWRAAMRLTRRRREAPNTEVEHTRT